MRVPLSWLREYAAVPETESGRAVANRLVRAGLEVETVEELGADLSGPVVVGRVVSIEELTGFKKPIRHCQVDVGETDGTGSTTRSIVCGATNFAIDDLVVVALPGAELPGGFAIASRQTYDRRSDGMICSARELGLGDEHDGILVLPADAALPGEDAVALLGLRDDVLDIAVTADRGYCLSVRGVAREAATAYDVDFDDPAAAAVLLAPGDGYPVRLDDDDCDVFVAVTVTGVDPTVASPLEVQERVRKAGMRPISLAVDLTNLVMLETGQPLHAYDRDKLSGPVVVRAAAVEETLTTLDGARRTLDPDDLLITDDSGPIGLAGVMGGATTEISDATSAVVIEAAHFAPARVARASRRHRLSSEASRRFERGVDPALPLVAAHQVARLLVEYAGGAVDPEVTIVGAPTTPEHIALPIDLPDRVAGYDYGPERVVDLLVQVGCRMAEEGPVLDVLPPTWRPDLADPYDLVEEVARLHGYDAIEPVLPQAPAGRGLTQRQALRRNIGNALAAAGYVESLAYPFVGERIWDSLMLPADDPRRQALRLANPLSDEEPLLRTTLLPGLLTTLRRNLGRGIADVSLFEMGSVFLPDPPADRVAAPRLPVDRRPTDDELRQLFAAVPVQPEFAAVVLAGDREARGWWGSGRVGGWADAIEAARVIARAAGVDLSVRSTQREPWHPGRCAELVLGNGLVAGYAGELHPRVIGALELPPRTCAAEIDLEAIFGAAPGPVPSPRLANFPAALQDVALVVDEAVPAAEVQRGLVDGAGDVLEHIRLFDVYTGPQVGAGRKSLAYSLRFRAPDRTLTAEEASAAREGAVAEAARRTGATLRS